MKWKLDLLAKDTLTISWPFLYVGAIQLNQDSPSPTSQQIQY